MGNPNHSQAIYRNIRTAVEKLALCSIQVKFCWLPGHMDIPGNEIANRHTKDIASKIGLYKKPEICYLLVIKKQINDFFTNYWKKRWLD